MERESRNLGFELVCDATALIGDERSLLNALSIAQETPVDRLLQDIRQSLDQKQVNWHRIGSVTCRLMGAPDVEIIFALRGDSRERILRVYSATTAGSFFAAFLPNHFLSGLRCFTVQLCREVVLRDYGVHPSLQGEIVEEIWA